VVTALLQLPYEWAPIVSELAGASALLYSSMLLVGQARLAVGATLQELAFVQEAMPEPNTQQ